MTMTFDEYAEKYLGALTPEGRRLVQMGWNGRGEFGSNHIPEATKMVQGNVVSMGDLEDEDGINHSRSFLLQFSSVEDFHAAREAGQCRFTVFGGEV